MVEGLAHARGRAQPAAEDHRHGQRSHELGGEVVVGRPLWCTAAARGWKAIALTPASSTSRWARVTPVVSPGRAPERSFTVTGRPLPSRAARATATAVSGSSISAAPAPVLHTLGTGQPMLRSMRSAPASATVAAAERMTSGSWPNSCTATGPPARSVGWMRSISPTVFSLRWWTPKLDTISDTASPAP